MNLKKIKGYNTIILVKHIMYIIVSSTSQSSQDSRYNRHALVPHSMLSRKNANMNNLRNKSENNLRRNTGEIAENTIVKPPPTLQVTDEPLNATWGRGGGGYISLVLGRWIQQPKLVSLL